MTREEQLDWLRRLKSDISYMDFSVDVNVSLQRKNEYRQVLSEVIKALEQKPRWIPVNERLPKIADVYLVTRYYKNNVMNPSYLVDACFFDGSNTWYNDNRINHERAYTDNIIAWQENPEPYKPQKSEE